MMNLQQRPDGTMHLIDANGLSIDAYGGYIVETASTAVNITKSGFCIANPSSVATYTMDTPVPGSRKRLALIGASTSVTISPASTATTLTSSGATTILFSAKNQALELEAYQLTSTSAVSWAVISNVGTVTFS
jgi:hypothetical protein